MRKTSLYNNAYQKAVDHSAQFLFVWFREWEVGRKFQWIDVDTNKGCWAWFLFLIFILTVKGSCTLLRVGRRRHWISIFSTIELTIKQRCLILRLRETNGRSSSLSARRIVHLGMVSNWSNSSISYIRAVL